MIIVTHGCAYPAVPWYRIWWVIGSWWKFIEGILPVSGHISSTLKAFSHTAISQTKTSTYDDTACMNCFCVNSVRLHSVFSVSQKYTWMLKIPALQVSCYVLVSSEICIANSFIWHCLILHQRVLHCISCVKHVLNKCTWIMLRFFL